jgi:hydrogenase maturation factor HypF (carbamoyltransferase family)
MHNDPVDNMKARVRCPECRNTFRARIHRLVFSEPVWCPVCRTELKFRVSHHADSEDVQQYIKYVEARTHRPHFYVSY